MDADDLTQSNIWSRKSCVNLNNNYQSTCNPLDFELSSWQARKFFDAEGSCFKTLEIYSHCKIVLFIRIMAEYLCQGPSRFELRN